MAESSAIYDESSTHDNFINISHNSGKQETVDRLSTIVNYNLVEGEQESMSLTRNQILKKEESKNKTDNFLLLTIKILAVVLIADIVVLGLLYLPPPSSNLTCIFLITNDYIKSLTSINSFLDTNQCELVLIGSHYNYGTSKNEPDLVTKLNNDNIVWKISDFYSLGFINNLIQMVHTDYYFFAETEYFYTGNDFVQYSIQVLRKQEKVGQVLPISEGVPDTELRNVGFSWKPGVHRKSDYPVVENGFANALRIKEQTDFYYTVKTISAFYLDKGFYLTTNKTDMKIDKIETPRVAKIRRVIRKSKNLLGFLKNYVKSFFSTFEPARETPTFSHSATESSSIMIYNNYYFQPMKRNVGDHLLYLLNQTSEPLKIFEIDLLTNISDLPICTLLLANSDQRIKQMEDSIYLQKYSNVRILTAPTQFRNFTSAQPQRVNYFDYFSLLETKCDENSFVMFVTAPLRAGALITINQQLQQNRAWIIYDRSSSNFEILGFYLRIYELLRTYDLNHKNENILKEENRAGQTLGMLELCLMSAKKIGRKFVYSTQEPAYFSVQVSDKSNLTRYPYMKLFHLSQDFNIDLDNQQRSYNKIKDLHPSQSMKMSPINMYRAVDRQQSCYLPKQHSIISLEQQQYNSMYNMEKHQYQQIPFCITVLSHNNIHHNRYIKVMKSIIMQDYRNFHIVFIDDKSTDANMAKTKEWLDASGFPRKRVTYVQNLRRNYATYNIVNAAYNYCGEEDVQVLVDGDDELIGRYALQVLNAAYQQKETWVAYSNYKSNIYQFGRSKEMKSNNDHVSNSQRTYVSLFGAVRTFRVKTLYQIPIAHHKMSNGEWLDTVYDDALAHPLFELSGFERVQYVPEVLYEYNTQYGDNDDSTQEKIIHRKQIYHQIVRLPVLKQLETLNETIKDPEIVEELNDGYGVRYQLLQ